MSTNVERDSEFNDSIPKRSSQQAFRLSRVLAALGIIGVLMILLLLPACRSARPAARRAQRVNNLKQIAMALRNYELAYDALPPAYTVDAEGRPLHSWRTLILPYCEQEALYRTIDLAKPWNDPANARALATPVPGFRCPETTGPENTTTYLAIVAPNDCFLPRDPRRLAEITDPRESTLMMIEAGGENAVPWMAPVDADEPLVMGIGPTTKLQHAGGTNACFVDGSVRFMKATTPALMRRALLSISGNDNKITTDW